AMRRALDGIEINYDEIIIDGHYNFLPDAKNVKLLVKADDLIPCVGAASIIAKVARDNWMAQTADKKFPEYFFNKHVGYGTKLHLEMLKIYGTSELHRQSFKPVKLINETALSK
ncbi:MAG: ribonuclease HII, partial [Candidatus Saccharimonadales bacterium]